MTRENLALSVRNGQFIQFLFKQTTFFTDSNQFPGVMKFPYSFDFNHISSDKYFSIYLSKNIKPSSILTILNITHQKKFFLGWFFYESLVNRKRLKKKQWVVYLKVLQFVKVDFFSLVTIKVSHDLSPVILRPSLMDDRLRAISFAT